MSYSEARGSMPVLVFTNSVRDYCITIGAGTAPQAEALVTALATAVAERVSESFEGIVGIGPWPGKPECLMAFRVFNAGVYLGRPNTVSVLAVGVPLRAHRDWGVGALLASVPPPQPDANSYTLPSEFAPSIPPQLSGAFVSLEQCDQRHARAAPLGLRGFGRDADVVRRISVLSSGDKVRACAIPRKTLIGVAAIALLAILAAMAWRLVWHGDGGTLPPDQPASAIIKADLQQLLQDTGIANVSMMSRSANPLALECIVVETSGELGRRVKSLRGIMGYENPDLHTLLKKRADDEWNRPPAWRTTASEAPRMPADRSHLARAVDVHREYQRLRPLLQDAAKVSPDSPDFASRLMKLREALGIDQ